MIENDVYHRACGLCFVSHLHVIMSSFINVYDDDRVFILIFDRKFLLNNRGSIAREERL